MELETVDASGVEGGEQQLPASIVKAADRDTRRRQRELPGAPEGIRERVPLGGERPLVIAPWLRDPQVIVPEGTVITDDRYTPLRVADHREGVAEA